MNCDRGLISEYYDGELGPAARAQVASHLAACAECRATLQAYRGLGEALRAFDAAPAPASLRARFWARTQTRQPGLLERLAGLLSARPRSRPLALGTLGALSTLAVVLGIALATAALWQPAQPLTVVAAYPADGASDVVLDAPFEVQFSEPVDARTVQVAIRLDPPVPATTKVEGNRLIIQPEEPLKPDTQYVVRIEPRQADTPAPAASPVTLSFSTGRLVAAAASATAVARPVLAAASPSPAASPAALAAAPAATIGATAPAMAVAVASPILTPPTAGAAVAAASTSPTASRSAAAAAIAPTAGPAAAVASGASPCGAEVGPLGARAIQQRPDLGPRLGCALAAERTTSVVEQGFEGGAMLALPDRPEFVVLLAGGRWATYPNRAQIGASPAPTAASQRVPGKTFGRLWVDRLDVRGPLGGPTGPEVSHLASIQSFARGTVLGADSDTAYVLLDDRTWLRVGGAARTATPSATATAQPTPRPASLTATPAPTAGASAAPTSTAAATPTAAPRTPAATPGTPTPGATASATPTASPATTPASAPSPTPTSPATSTAAATPVAATSTPGAAVSATATPTATRPASQPETPARATPARDAAACDVPVAPTFGPAFGGKPELATRLGCALAPGVEVAAAEELFEGGYVYWRGDIRQVYILYDDGAWEIVAETWQEGEPERGGEAPPANRVEPARGIGEVWREAPGVRARLGWAREPERGFTGLVQPFERGLALGSPSGWTYVLSGDGTWQKLRGDSRGAEQ